VRLPEPDLRVFQHHDWAINGLRMHVAEAGSCKGDAQTIIFLHGFPDLWCGWARIMLDLASDFRCLAPDQRGYNLTTRPHGVGAYAPNHLLSDLTALIDHASPDVPIVLVGHDWGGVIAAWFLASQPGRIAKSILVNTTHPALLQQALWHDAEQRDASRYILSLRSGALEERWRAAGHHVMAHAATLPHREAGTMSAAEAALYHAAWSDPEAWRAMIDWYRAAPFSFDPPAPGEDWTAPLQRPIDTPTLLLWGASDPIFKPILRDGLDRYFNALQIDVLEGVGHNPLRDAPGRVAQAIRTFLSDATTRPQSA